MKNYSNLSEAITGLKQEGYTEDFNRFESCIESSSTAYRMKHHEFKTGAFLRVEGESNPSEEVMVYAIFSNKYNLKGVLGNGYGLLSEPLADELIKKTKHPLINTSYVEH